MYSNELNKRRKTLEKFIEKVQQELPDLPKGNLRIAKSGKTVQYFLVEEKGDNRGRYLKKDSMDLIKGIAKRNYYEKLLRVMTKEERTLIYYLENFGKGKPEKVYDSLSEYRKSLIHPLLVSDEEYSEIWETTPYEKNPYHPEECTQPTEKGDLVRSKSEARIADMYFSLGIPYKYEAPLKLRNGKTKYPDFTLFNVSERKEYYHEHMGMMEDESYLAANLVKLNEYAESGIFTGKNLILTFETDLTALNIKTLRKNIQDIFFAG